VLNFFWESAQSRQLLQIGANAAEAKTQSKDAGQRIAQLESDVDRLLLVCRALWELLRERNELDDRQLIDKIRETDLRDGHLDGKLSRTAVRRCAECGQTIHRRHLQCIYCGSARLQDDPFDTVR
jgi:hypothetical protein